MAATPLVVNLLVPTKGLDRDLKRAGRTLNRFSTKANRQFAGIARGASSAFTGVGRGAAAGFGMAGRAAKSFGQVAAGAAKGVGILTTAVTGIGVASVKSFQEMDREIREIATLIPEATQETVDALRKETVGLSKEFGFAGQEFADAYYDALSAGIDREDAMAFLGESAKLATAGNAELTASTDVLTSALNAFDLEADQAGMVSDVLFGTVKQGKTTIDELGRSFSNVGPVAAGLNVGLEETLGLVAQLTLSGTPTAEAMTQARQAMAELGNSSTKAFKAFQEATGQTFPEFMEATGGDMPAALAALNEHAEETGTVITDMFGSIEAKQAIGQAVGDLEGYQGIVDELANSAGASDEAFSVMAAGFDMQVNRLKATFEAAKVNIGGALVPYLNEVLPKVTGIVDKIAQADLAGYFGKIRDNIDRAVLPRIMRVRTIFGQWKNAVKDNTRETGTLGERWRRFVSDYLGPFTDWKKKTWDPFTEDLSKEWNVQVAVGAEKNPNFDATVNQINSEVDTKIPSAASILVDFALSSNFATMAAGLFSFVAGLLSGNPVLMGLGLTGIGIAVASYVSDQEWFKNWIDETITPYVDEKMSLITGYGQALFGAVTGNKDWISQGLTRAGKTTTKGTDNDQWVNEWVQEATTWVDAVSQFLGYGLLIFGILRLNIPAITAGIALSQVSEFTASEDKGDWIGNAVTNVVTAAANFAKVVGLTMMIGGAITRNLQLVKSGAKVAAYAFTPEVIGGTTWMGTSIDDVVKKVDEFGKPVGLALMMWGAFRLNWKLAGIGYGLYKTSGDLGDETSGDLFSLSGLDDWGPLAISTGLAIAAMGARSGNLAVTGIGLGIAAAGGLSWVAQEFPGVLSDPGSAVSDVVEEKLEGAGVTPPIARVAGGAAGAGVTAARDFITGGVGGLITGAATRVGQGLKKFGETRRGVWDWGSRHTGGPIHSSGLYSLEAGEHVLTEDQNRAQGGGGMAFYIQNVTVEGVNDPDEFATKMEVAARRRFVTDENYMNFLRPTALA